MLEIYVLKTYIIMLEMAETGEQAARGTTEYGGAHSLARIMHAARQVEGIESDWAILLLYMLYERNMILAVCNCDYSL